MLSNIGAALSSTLVDFSKLVTTTVVGLENAFDGEVKGVPTRRQRSAQAAKKHVEVDMNVVRSYYARAATSRPSSRLLTKTMFQHGNKGPRSAPLLVPGSSALMRPWRYAFVTLSSYRTE